VCAAALMWVSPWAHADDDRGRRGGGGHHHGHHHDDSNHFLGISPYGLSYGFQNDNFGMLIGPFGGGYGNHYHDHGYPAYEPPIVSQPAYSYAAPAVDYGGYAPPTASPVTSTEASSVDAPTPEFANLNAGSASYYRKSVDAFRSGDYAAATKAADHAIVEDSQNGALRTHASQCLLANGEFEAAAAALSDGLSMLPEDQWGNEIRSFRKLYRKNDYVTHVKQLEQFAKQNPEAAAGNALCAYHFYFLGHESAAQRHLAAARQVDPNYPLVAQLSQIIATNSDEELPSPGPKETTAKPTSILVGPK
jgi:hypothetical protein